MRSVPVEMAGRDFFTLIREIESGERFMITRNGEPIARLEPCGASASEKMEDPGYEAAYRRMVANMRKGAHLGGLKIGNRDEIYER